MNPVDGTVGRHSAGDQERVDQEEGRLRALYSFDVMDTPAEAAFDDLTALAARRCGTPMAMITLIDADRQWFKSRIGVEPTVNSTEMSFCAYALSSGGVMVVPDTLSDPRFIDHPLVSGPPHYRFYAGAPLVVDSGHVVGTLCVLDTAPRDLTTEQAEDLNALARQVVGQLELRRNAARLAAGVQANLRVEAELRGNRRVLDAILAHTDVLIYAKDLDGRFVIANKAMTDLVNRPDGVIGRTDRELFPPHAAQEFQRNDLRVAATGSGEVFEEQLPQPDGSHRAYRSTKFPLRDDPGRIYAVAGVSMDITELSAARQAAVESEQRWRALVENSPVAVAVIGAASRFIYANPEALKLCGAHNLGDIVGRAATDLVPAEDRIAVAATFDSVVRGDRRLQDVRSTLRRLDGELRTVEVNAAAIAYGGQPAVQVELRDIHVQAAADQALKASERRFHALFTGSPVAMALSDENGRWVETNRAMEHLLGVGQGELIGSTALDHAHPDDHWLVANSEQGQQASADGIMRSEIRFVRPDGGLRWTWVNITPTPGPGGRIWTLAIAQDITARKAAETSLLESEADLAAIAAVTRSMQSGDDPRPMVVSTIHTLSGASTVAMLESLDADHLVVSAAAGTDLLGTPVSLHETSMTARVWRSGEPVFLSDAACTPAVDPALPAPEATVSVLWQPVVTQGKVQAVLTVTWRHRVPDLGGRAVRAVRVIADEAGTLLHATRLRRDLELSASTDPLTGSLNRRAWNTRLEMLLEQTRQTGASLTIALVDLDHFKAYNDKWGHTAGDVLLHEFASAAGASLRKDDVFARWGGEEFSLALPDCTAAQAELVLERIRMGVPAGCTCSIGHTTWRPDEPLSASITRADAALYDAKRAGRNRISSR